MHTYDYRNIGMLIFFAFPIMLLFKAYTYIQLRMRLVVRAQGQPYIRATISIRQGSKDHAQGLDRDVIILLTLGFEPATFR